MPDLDAFQHGTWLQRIRRAEDSQGKLHETWRRSLKLYNMQYWKEQGYNAQLSDQITPVNYTTTFINTLVAATYSRNPKIFVRARSGERYVKFAETMELLQARDWEENDLKEVLISALIDALITNIGWVENGFIPSVTDNPEPEVAQPEPQGMLDIIQATGNRLLGRQPTPPLAPEGRLDEHQQVGEFFSLRRSPYDVLFPDGFHDYWSMPYLIVRERLRMEDFFNDPRFINKGQAISMVLPESQFKKLSQANFDFRIGLGTSSHVSDQQVIELFTIWDRRSQSTFTLSKGTVVPHIAPHDWPYFSEGFPLIPLQFNQVPDTPEEANAYGFSDVEPITPQVIEKSNIRTDMVDHRRRASIVVFVQKGSSTEDELNNMQHAAPMAIIPVTSLQAIQVSQPIQIPPATLQTESAINSDLDRDSGLQLILADTARTAQFERATVATIAQGNANLKTGYRVDRIEAFARRIARFRAGLFWQYMTKEDVGEIVGFFPDEDQWPTLPSDPELARRRIRRELEFRIEAGSTRPIQDDVLDREQFLRWGSIFQATSPQLFSQIEREFHSTLAKKFREPQIEALVLRATSQEQEQEAQRENQLMLQGHPQSPSACEDHETHLKVHGQLAQQLQQQAGQNGQSDPQTDQLFAILDQHISEHGQLLETRAGATRGGGQGVRQSAAAPSGAETRRMGTPDAASIGGQALNLRAGTGPQGARTA